MCLTAVFAFPWRGGEQLFYSSARNARTATRAFAFGTIGRSPADAGVTFTNRTTSAPWAARYAHTSVIDAAGTIYVIGGDNGKNYLNDVWASTDGGARAGLRPGGCTGWVLRGY